VHDHTVYLDHASTSWPKHPASNDAVAHALGAKLGTPGRGSHRFATDAHNLVERTRTRIAAYLNADHSDRIVLTAGATDALNLAIFGTLAHRDDRPHVVASVLEHNAVAAPLVALESAGKITLTRVPCNPRGYVEPRAFLGAIKPETALAAITAVSNVLGTAQPIDLIGPALHEHAPDALLLVDAAQAVGVVPVDVEQWHADLLAFSGHKALRGPSGTGALYISKRAFNNSDEPHPLRPFRFGGTGGHVTSPIPPARAPARFEPGTPNTPGLAGLAAAIEHAHPNAQAERNLLDPFIEHFASDQRVRLLAGAAHNDQNRIGVLSFNIDGFDPHTAAAIFDTEFGIAVRAGLHCAPWTHEHLGTLNAGGAIRVSVGETSTPEHIDRLVAAVRAIIHAG